MNVPESVRVVIRGGVKPNVAAKDFILAAALAGLRPQRAGAGEVIEYAGEAIEELNIDERATLTNMAAEIGGFTGIVAPDEKVGRFPGRASRGCPCAEAEKSIARLYSDPDAQYALRHRTERRRDLSDGRHAGRSGQRQVRPRPEHPRAGRIAYGGTCTAGKNDDMDMYAPVLVDALKQGKRSPPHEVLYSVRLATDTRILHYEGIPGRFRTSRRHRHRTESCGACINAGPGVSTRPDQVVICAQNRNFPEEAGRDKCTLASPLTVAASAVAGYIVEFETSGVRRPTRSKDTNEKF